MTAMTLMGVGGIVLAVLALSACTGHRQAAQREVELIRKHLDLPEGATVADIGAGNGGHAVALARALGADGQVLATEIDAGKVAALAKRAGGAGLDNLRAIQGGSARTGLPAECCDGVYMRGVYHHLTDPAPTLADIYDALRPGGRLLVIDFPPSFWLKPWTPKNLPADRTGHGIVPRTVEAEARAAGFIVEECLEDWPGGPLQDLYGLVFRKPPADAVTAGRREAASC